jgi:ABC-type multidrug transport system fused ATPase/permease subunit
LDLAQYRARIGYAPQNPSLFNTSVRNNLLWVKPDATERELTEVCERSDAMGFIRELEHGLDTIVGERGARLSGGQVQRISFARALLRKPEILILDEPFSSIDPGSEAKIMDAAMDSVKDALVLMATHRESILTLSDHVYHLEMGNLTAR